MPQRAIQRHTSQPVLKKQLFYGYRIQDRDVPDLHLSAPLLDRPSTADQHQCAGAPLPFLRVEGVHSSALHRQKGQSDQVEYEMIQLHTALHWGLSPSAQGKGIHTHQSYPTPTSSGHLAASPPSLGKLLGTTDTVNRKYPSNLILGEAHEKLLMQLIHMVSVIQKFLPIKGRCGICT